jgi:hypothetical protein
MADYWQDGCEYGGVKWPYRTGVKDPAKCRQVMRWYFARYGAKTDEQKARCHNAGSNWKNRYAATNGYWAKVKAVLNKKG